MKRLTTILFVLALTLACKAQVTLVGEKAAKIVVDAGDSLTSVSPTTIALAGKITGHPTDYYWTHDGLGSIADSTRKNTSYTVSLSDTVIHFDLVAFYNFSGVLDTVYHRRVVTIDWLIADLDLITVDSDLYTVDEK